MGVYCGAVWHSRYFWLSLVSMDLRARYRGSVLGVGWSLLQPLGMTLLFTVLFCQIFGQDPYHYPAYVLTGLAFWGYLQNAVVQGCRCFLLGEIYIRQHPAPLAIYPLRVMLGGAFHLLMALGAALLLVLIIRSLPQQAPLTGVGVMSLLSLVPTLALLLCFGWAIALLAGLAHVHFRDTAHLAELGLQVLFYMTPIMYPRSLLAERGLALLIDWNPLVPFVELLRRPIVAGAGPNWEMYARASSVVVLLMGLAAWALSRLEKKLIFHL